MTTKTKTTTAARPWCRMTTIEYRIKPGTAAVWEAVKRSSKALTERQYRNITDTETLRFFRRLGGSEYAERHYTCRGYLIGRLLSTSPDRSIRRERLFDFDNV